MAKLECPECNSTLNPARPPAPGKKVRCPRCEAIFVVPNPGEAKSDNQSSPAARKKKVQSSAKKSSTDKDKKSKQADEDEEETYGFGDSGFEDDKLEIDYAPDITSKNPRGPATALLAEPTTWLLRFAALNLVASIVSILFWIWPFIFTPYSTTLVPADYVGRSKPDEQQSQSRYQDPNKKKVKPDDLDDGDRALWDDDVADEQQERTIWAVASFLFMLYCGVLSYATVQMQNLESYKWSMTCCIMALIIPDTTGFGIWGIRQLRKEDVKAAFFYTFE